MPNIGEKEQNMNIFKELEDQATKERACARELAATAWQKVCPEIQKKILDDALRMGYTGFWIGNYTTPTRIYVGILDANGEINTNDPNDVVSEFTFKEYLEDDGFISDEKSAEFYSTLKGFLQEFLGGAELPSDKALAFPKDNWSQFSST